MLEERVFQIDGKWPQYRRLLADMDEFARSTAPDATVVCLERTLLYGGCSLFAPLFTRQAFVSVHCSPESAEARGAPNADMVAVDRSLAAPATRRAHAAASGLASGCARLDLVPNPLHKRN